MGSRLLPTLATLTFVALALGCEAVANTSATVTGEEMPHVVRKEWDRNYGYVDKLVPATATSDKPYVETRAGRIGWSHSVTPNRPYRDGEPVTIVMIARGATYEIADTLTGRDMRDVECQLQQRLLGGPLGMSLEKKRLEKCGDA